MNIKQAKEYIKDSVKLYLKKDEFGAYRIPVVRQRPIFMLGAPGIGKTAIMEQIAQEMGIALVSYSMTHHTRQSALGLPFIAHKEYQGQSFDVSEYTMSEIIASVYETMENSGLTEGILFLDEINCVSETLAPSMLQFLQYKVFGRHCVPEGWVIVTAGNPPEYNRSVREFDVVTMDRLKLLEVDPDFEVFKEYARGRKLHGSVTGYLELNRDDFYVIETTVKGRGYVTARGWEDLSQMLRLYEEEDLTVDETLVGQYLRNDRIVREFTAYYDLYQKYKNDYKIPEILAGQAPESTKEKARKAPFDERLSLMGLLTETVQDRMSEIMGLSELLSSLAGPLRAVRDGDRVVEELLQLQQQGRQKQMENLQKAGALSDRERKASLRLIRFYQDALVALRRTSCDSRDAEFEVIRSMFGTQKETLRTMVSVMQGQLDHLFAFVNDTFGEGNELILLLTELTVGTDSTAFLATFGSESFRNYSDRMMLTGRQDVLMDQVTKLEI